MEMTVKMILTGIEDSKKVFERKLWLATTCGAFQKGSNKKTVDQLRVQIGAMDCSLQLLKKAYSNQF